MTVEDAVETLWAYHHVGHEPEPADLIFVLGSNDPRVASWAAELYFRRLSRHLLFSGGEGRFTEGMKGSEAERFADVARAAGVPDSAILIEARSTNTGENIRFSREVMAAHGLTPSCVLALQKPYMERRTLATLEAQWPEVAVRVSSPPCTFREYLSEELPEELVVSAMVGDFQRILEYPKRGFSSEQPVTQDAREAFLVLVEAGYVSQLLQDVSL